MTKDQIAELCEKFNAAERSGDTSSLQSLLADDFQSIGPKGFILSKRQWIERLEHFHYETLQVEECDMAIYENVAIVRYMQASKARYNDKAVTMKMRVSQVWIMADESCQMVAIQFSPMD